MSRTERLKHGVIVYEEDLPMKDTRRIFMIKIEASVLQGDYVESCAGRMRYAVTEALEDNIGDLQIRSITVERGVLEESDEEREGL